jgi:hypothetical protein
MTFQTTDLRMVTLGVKGDVPPNALQPSLPDGVHLRWAFDPVKGFPWYGYYLFRRPAQRATQRHCLSTELAGRLPGVLPGGGLTLGYGTLASDKPLVLTDDFPASGTVEVDLGDRDYLMWELPDGLPACQVTATIGFRAPRAVQPPECVDFRPDKPGSVANPLVAANGDVTFTRFDASGAQSPAGQVRAAGGTAGWSAGVRAVVALLLPAAEVEVTLLPGADVSTLTARDSSGNAVATGTVSGTGQQTVVLHAASIATVEVDTPKDGAALLLRLCWFPTATAGEPTTITVSALDGGQKVAQTSLSGGPGIVQSVTLTADAFDTITIGPGNAALVDLCVVAVGESLQGGWQPLTGLSYPLALPTPQPDYPCPGKPATLAAAQTAALARVSYGPAAAWSGDPFTAVEQRLERLVAGGPPPGGQAMADRSDPVPGTPAPPPETGGALTQPRQRPLDLLMLGSLNPAVAQILGLYWLDATAVPGVPYDYLLLADHANVLGGTAASALTWVSTVADYTVVDGCACFGVVAQPAPPVLPPADVRVYALPGTTIAPADGGAVIDGTNNAGLTWDRQQTGTTLAAGAPLLYHVWRAALGDADTPATPADSDFSPLTADAPLPVGYSIMADPQIPDQPDDWPPFSMNYIDRALAEGWYGYRVSSVDLFGRHSAHSPSGPWYQWAPSPVPPPWYYTDPPADRVIDLASIQLLDKTPPPPPTGVEAFALDPADPSVLKDAAWQAWQATLGPAEQASVVGLRVRWWWTQANQRQAPDTREFRIYFQPAPVNTLRGRVTSVAAASATESLVLTDIANAQPAGAFTGASVRIGATSFAVTGSEAGTPLTLQVSNVGPTAAVTPAAGSRCALVLPDGSALRQDFRMPAAWQERVHVVGIGESSVADSIGNRYEVLLPVPADTVRTGLPLATTLAEPVAMAVIGVTAADDKPHTPDSRGDPARFGNESMIGGPATVLRVLRTPPTAPDVLPDAEKVFASPADYHDQSYFTYRWLPPAAGLKTLVYRALDDGVFQADLARRPRPPLTGTEPAFPLTDPAWTPARCQQTATELNKLNTLNLSNPPAPAELLTAAAAYRALSNDALRVLAGLSGTEKVFIQLSTQPLDPADPQWLTVGPDLPADSLPAGQRAYVDTLDGRAGNRYFYRSAHIDEVHNVGPLGLSSPPVWLPKVTPPRAPVISSMLGGERQATLGWASNREPDLAHYLVYRADNADAARDVRLMTLAATLPVAVGDPAARPAAVTWTDTPVPGLVTFYYRLVAVDTSGNASSPSQAVAIRAHDEALPVPPPLAVAWDTATPPLTATATWTSTDDTLLELRAAVSAIWDPVGDWQVPGSYTQTLDIDHTFDWQVRLRVRKYTGAAVIGGPVALTHV